ncbi:MAG TPA: sensor histidine kinase [Feifaniaceae bacterium]|nr:sensor histidine kinase [Feifaniaceae bacterium]
MKRWVLLPNAQFRTRLVALYILIALIPLVLFALVSGAVSISRAQNTAASHTAQMVSQVSNSIDVYIRSIDKLANLISLSLQREAASGAQSAYPRAALTSALYDVAASHPEIAGILVAMEDDTCIPVGMSRISRDPFREEEWYKRAARTPADIALVNSIAGRNVTLNGDTSTDNVFSLAKAVTDPDTGEVLGVVLFDVRHDILKDSISSITIGENGFVFVTDAEGNIIYTPLNDIVYRVNPQWLTAGDAIFPVSIRNAEYQIHVRSSPYTGWKTVGVFALKEVMGNVNSMLAMLTVAMLVSVAIISLVALPLSNSVTKPLLKLQRLMKQAESGDLTVHFNTQYHDEIGELGNSFNHMLSRIDELIHQVYEEQRHKRDAEMKSLQEQIKPHFLYNTLDTISWMAREYEAADIVQLVDALTSMYRIGLSQGRDVITVEEEVRHVSNYLYIQEIRYKSKLKYRIETDPATLSVEVPKLILQPLVENAIYHGIKKKRGGGTVVIESERKGDHIRLTVRDDGAGMDAAQLAALRAGLGEERGQQSFGLYYVKERIRLYYGTDYSIAVDSAPEEGTSVTISLPLERLPVKEANSDV